LYTERIIWVNYLCTNWSKSLQCINGCFWFQMLKKHLVVTVINCYNINPSNRHTYYTLQEKFNWGMRCVKVII
jgi:replication initiation and membrane attachment protein DnaB